MGTFVLDTSLALKWFLDDEEDREYSRQGPDPRRI
jgi:hypothetical protein